MRLEHIFTRFCIYCCQGLALSKLKKHYHKNERQKLTSVIGFLKTPNYFNFLQKLSLQVWTPKTGVSGETPNRELFKYLMNIGTKIIKCMPSLFSGYLFATLQIVACQILQAKILEWVAMPSSRTSWPRDQTYISPSPALAGKLLVPPGY